MLVARKNTLAVLTLTGAVLTASVLVTAAFAGPPKHNKHAKKPPAKSSAALITAGKKVYAANGCAGCHSIAGKGGKTGPNLTTVAAEAKHTPKWLEEQVLNPKAHDADSKMPPYEGRIKGKDLQALVAYLGSLKK